MLFDTLESRRLLTFNAGVVGGTLQILCGADAVNITITNALDSLRVTDLNDGTSQDFLTSTVQRISLTGGLGNDRVSISSAVNRPSTLNGAKGDDTLIGGGGADRIMGGVGLDTADYSARSANLRISLDDTANDGATSEQDNVDDDIETILGGAGNDRIEGSADDNQLLGNGGKDTLFGQAGDDTLSGGNKNDKLDGGTGEDFLVGSAGTLDVVDYSSRTAAVFVTIDDDDNDGESGESDNIAATMEVFVGGSGNDSLIGSGKPNSLFGGAGNDTLRGGGGGDTIFGQAGRDSILGEGGNDVIFALDGEIDTVSGGSGSDLADADGTDDVSAVP